MTSPIRTPILENWFIALLLSLALGLCSLTSQQAFADEADDDTQTEEQSDDPEEDDDSDDGDDNSKGNKGKHKGNQGKNKSGDDDSDEIAKGGKPHCQKSAQYLFLACKHMTHAARWERLAECENILDRDQRSDCFTQNREFFASDRQSCRTQRNSRKGVCDEVGREVYQGWDDVRFWDDGAVIVDNDYFPLSPSSSVYVATETTIDREVTESTRKIDGVTCKLVVEEERYKSDPGADPGILLERVERLYAHDVDDNIWTCGVLRQQYGVLVEGEDPVVVSTLGSWEAGSAGAKAGIAMHAIPILGETYRRSYAPGIDEELAEVIDPISLAPGVECVGDCIVLRITSPLAPEGYRDEYYESGTGLIHSENQGGDDTLYIVQP